MNLSALILVIVLSSGWMSDVPLMYICFVLLYFIMLSYRIGLLDGWMVWNDYLRLMNKSTETPRQRFACYIMYG